MDRRTAMDYLMSRRMRDGRNPYGSRGGYVDTRNPYGSRGGYVDSRRDRGMDNAYDRRDYNSNDYQYDSRRGDRAYQGQGMERNSRDYQQYGQSDMARGDYADMNRHYMRGDYNDMAMRGGSTYYPIEAMGTFNGYYGMPEDYARGGRSDYRSDYAGDYGETLNHKEIEKWNKRLMKEVEEKDKQFFSKENISSKARNMGISFDKYNEEELAVATAMMYTDYCKALKPFVGANMDVYVKLADAFLNDKDASVKGGEKLAVYHDCIVEDKEEDDD